MQPDLDDAVVLVNGQHVFCGTWDQCHAYITLLNFGPDDLVQLQALVWTPGGGFD